MTDSSGDVADTYTYDAYGELIASTGNTENNYLYTGEQYDSNLDKYYLRARYYDPSVGRFTARDPFEGVFTEPLSLAKYPYAHGNPVNLTDPSGLSVFAGFFSTQNALQSLNQTLTNAFLATAIQLVGLAGTITIQVATYLAAVYALADQVPRRLGIPVLVYGGDIPETARHVFRAITFSGNTKNNPNGNLMLSSFISPVTTRKSRYPGDWYRDEEPCLSQQRTGQVCDEFPYATTVQGGKPNWDVDKVSLLPVPASEQTNFRNLKSQVRILGRFYRSARISRQETNTVNPLAIFANFSNPLSPETVWYDRNGNGLNSFS